MNTRQTRPLRAAPLIGLLAVLPVIAIAAGPETSIWTCTSGDFVREITLFSSNDPAQEMAGVGEQRFACRVEYSKNGVSEELWIARNDPDFCQPKVLALVRKLQAAGFRCQASGAPIESTERSLAGAADTGGQDAPSAAERAPLARTSDDAALRALLERYYEDFYLDAMVAVIPAGFTVGASSDAVSAKSGAVFYVAPPNHFVKTMADGSYVLVNTLVLRRDSTSSFVNLGFVVRDNRYSFLGYAIAHAAVEAKVSDADADEVTLMATTAATATCEGVRRTQTLPWLPDFAAASSQQSKHAQTGSSSTSDCTD